MDLITPDQITDEYIIIDTRAPKEYQDHHIPNAISIPLFDDLQRHEIGFLYKQVSIPDAYNVALDYAQVNTPRILKSFEKYKDKKLLIYCSRGGLRSGIIASFLKHYNYNVTKLKGGMKSYRNQVLKDLEMLKIPKIILIHGLVGAGKTEYIKRLENKIDLEECAQHMGSAFGAITKKPNSQKQFLFELRNQLRNVQDKPFIFVEFESRRIGNVEIPRRFWEAMARAEIWFLDVDLKKRVHRYLKVFPQDKEHQKQYIEIAKTLRGNMSNEILNKIIEAFEKEDYELAWSLLWEHHYDPAYQHGTKHLKFTKTIDANDFEKTLKLLREYEKRTLQNVKKWSVLGKVL